MSVKVRENLLTNSYFNTNCRIQHSGGDEVSEEFKWGLKMRLAKRSVFLGVAVLCTVGAYFKREPIEEIKIDEETPTTIEEDLTTQAPVPEETPNTEEAVADDQLVNTQMKIEL